MFPDPYRYFISGLYLSMQLLDAAIPVFVEFPRFLFVMKLRYARENGKRRLVCCQTHMKFILDKDTKEVLLKVQQLDVR